MKFHKITRLAIVVCCSGMVLCCETTGIDSHSKIASKIELPWWVNAAGKVNPIDRYFVFPLSNEQVLRGRSILREESPVGVGSSPLKNRLEELLQQAEKALKFEPVNVIQKWEAPDWKELSVSLEGLTRNDYVSFARYTWPNPDTPNGFPYVWIDGKPNRALFEHGDAKSLYKMLDATERLALAYAYTSNNRYALKAEEILRAWFLSRETAMSPHLRYGRVRPGDKQGAANGLIDTRGFFKLPDVLRLLRKDSGISSETLSGMEKWLRNWYAWIENDPIGKAGISRKNNQGSWVNVQRVAWVLYEKDTAKATSLCIDFQKRIDEQIEPDGRQREELERVESLHYHMFNLHALLVANEFCREVAVDLWSHQIPTRGSLAVAAAFLEPYMKGVKSWPGSQGSDPDRQSLIESLAILKARGYF